MVVVAVPEGQLLVTVGGVNDGVQVDGQMMRRLVEGGDELVNEDITDILEGLNGDGILEARQGGLAGQVIVVGGTIGEEFEDGVMAESVMVILVLVVGEDAVNAGANHLGEGVIDEVGVAGSCRASVKAWVRPMR